MSGQQLECEVLVVNTRGSTPGKPGAKMRVGEEGLLEGTVGGGKIELRAIEQAQQLIRDRASTFFATWNLQRDLGMTCGGEVSLFFETKGLSVFKIAIFGAGHIAQALSYHLRPLKAQVVCVDDRREWLEKLPLEIQRQQLDDWREFSEESIDTRSFCVIMTRSSDLDQQVAEKLMKKDFPYVGIVGSRIKSRKIKIHLTALGLDSGRIERLRCPTGLPFGSHEPHEIALSILSELLTVRDRENPQEEGLLS
jgi:xanthine dehydrogenase accessory factor